MPTAAIPFGHQSVTSVRRTVTGRDEHGNDVYGETTQAIPGCSVQPTLYAKELLDGRDLTVNRLRLFAPAHVDLTSIDAIDVNGERYEITGEPLMQPDWSGGIHHVEAILERVTG